MNCASARCSRASSPRSTVKRAPLSLAAVSPSSQPLRAPSSTWSLTAKSNVRGVPQRACSTFCDSSAPTGTEGSGRLGMPSAIASISPRTASSRASLAFSSSPKPATSASSADTSSPLALAWPMALLRVLRRFCSSWVRTWIALRSASSASRAAASRSKPRLSRRRWAVSAAWVRSRTGSSIGSREVACESAIIARIHRPLPGIPASSCQNGSTGAGTQRFGSPMSAPSPHANRPDWLPGRGALLATALAFVLGLLAFLALWWDQRNNTDFYRTEPGLPPLPGQVFEPLPAPLPASERGSIAPEVEEAEERLEAQRDPVGGAEAPMAFPAPPPEPVAPPVAPTTRPTTLPHPIQQPAPRYPRDAYRRGEQGTVLLRVHVNARGEPGDIDLIDSSGSRSLDRAAIDAVRRWRFAPAMQGETPVEGTVQVPIEFALGR